MDKDNTLSQDLDARLDALAAQSSRTRVQIIEDALSNGRSLAWQEKWIAGVQAGLDDANDGNFVTDTETRSVLNKYKRT